MRLSTATTTDSVLRQLQRLNSRQADLQQQVATGQRVFQPGDDPAGVARIVAAQMERRSLTQYQRNADTALEYSKASFQNLEQLKSLSDRAGELAVLGSGANGAQAMAAYGAEVNQLLEQALTVGQSRLRNDYVFAGTAVDAPPFAATRDGAGQITAVSYAGDAGRVSVPLGDGAVIHPTPDATTNAGVADFLNQLVALRDALATGDAAAVQATRSALEVSEDLLVGALSEHGAVQLRIEAGQEQQLSRLNELERLISKEADADLPTTIVRLSQTTQAYEAALSSAATILRMSLLDYIS